MGFFNENFLSEKIIKISKVSKSNKGFISISYNVLVIIGDFNGGLGFGKGKNKDQKIAFERAFLNAKNNFFRIYLINGTIYHEIIGKHCNTTVYLKPSKLNGGLFCGSCIRFIFNIMGVTNIISKIYGSNNFYNIIRAVINALVNLKNPLF